MFAHHFTLNQTGQEFFRLERGRRLGTDARKPRCRECVGSEMQRQQAECFRPRLLPISPIVTRPPTLTGIVTRFRVLHPRQFMDPARDWYTMFRPECRDRHRSNECQKKCSLTICWAGRMMRPQSGFNRMLANVIRVSWLTAVARML